MDTQLLEKHLKKFQLATSFWSLAIGLITALGICYGFYYKTNDKLNEHTEKIKNVETKVVNLTEAVNSSAVFQGVSKEQIKSLEAQINDVKNTQIRIEDKITRIAEEMIKQNKSR